MRIPLAIQLFEDDHDKQLEQLLKLFKTRKRSIPKPIKLSEQIRDLKETIEVLESLQKHEKKDKDEKKDDKPKAWYSNPWAVGMVMFLIGPPYWGVCYLLWNALNK